MVRPNSMEWTEWNRVRPGFIFFNTDERNLTMMKSTDSCCCKRCRTSFRWRSACCSSASTSSARRTRWAWPSRRRPRRSPSSSPCTGSLSLISWLASSKRFTRSACPLLRVRFSRQRVYLFNRHRQLSVHAIRRLLRTEFSCTDHGNGSREILESQWPTRGIGHRSFD